MPNLPCPDWLRQREALKRMQGYAVDHSEGRWSSPGTVARMAHEVNAALAPSAEEEKWKKTLRALSLKLEQEER